MTNLSKEKRERMLAYLDKLKALNDDDEHIRAITEIENALNEKKYGLVWEEHSEHVDEMLEDHIPIFTEDNARKIVADKQSPYNFLLEGDNLHSLKLLEKTHKGKIDIIYIDPPYNMGKKDFVYNDRYIEDEDGYKHSKWLSFMNERLTIAHHILSKQGFIAISIDENEVAQLRILCDEIFGEKNLLSVQHIQVRYSNKNLNEKNDWQPVMEYVLIYAKDTTEFKANRPVEEYDIKSFKESIVELSDGSEHIINGRKVTVFKKGEWKRIKHKEPNITLLKATWISGSIYSDTGHGTTYQYIVEPRYDIDGYGSLYKIFGLGEDGLGYRYMRNPNSSRYSRGEMFTGIPLQRIDEIETQEGSIKEKPIINLFDYSAEFGNIRHEGGIAFNKGKKPIKMIKEIINYHKKRDVKVLDFFAGSGTTGHAVAQLNSEDGGNRKYILCTNNENNICEEVTWQRLNNIQADLPHNLKHFKTDFIKKFDREEAITDLLLLHIKELIELEHHIEVDDQNIVILLDESLISDVITRIEQGGKLFIASGIFLSRADQLLLEEKEIELIEIPEYYFREELREVGEL